MAKTKRRDKSTGTALKLSEEYTVCKFVVSDFCSVDWNRASCWRSDGSQMVRY